MKMKNQYLAKKRKKKNKISHPVKVMRTSPNHGVQHQQPKDLISSCHAAHNCSHRNPKQLISCIAINYNDIR